MIHNRKTTVGVTKIYRMYIGVDFIKFVVNLLISGAGVQQNYLLSKSSFNVINYLSFIGHNGKAKMKRNLGYFESENKTSHLRSVSKHAGYMLI